jgi:hypothetical protein
MFDGHCDCVIPLVLLPMAVNVDVNVDDLLLPVAANYVDKFKLVSVNYSDQNLQVV